MYRYYTWAFNAVLLWIDYLLLPPKGTNLERRSQKRIIEPEISILKPSNVEGRVRIRRPRHIMISLGLAQ